MSGAAREAPGLGETGGAGTDGSTTGDRLQVLIDSGFGRGNRIAAETVTVIPY